MTGAKTDYNTATVRFRFYLGPTAVPEHPHVIDVVRTVCAGVYGRLDAFDVVRVDPATARADNVQVTPTLERTFPAPARRFFGDFTDPERLHRLLTEDRRTLELAPLDEAHSPRVLS